MAHRLERTGRQQRPCSLVAAVKLLLLAVSHGSVAGQLWAQADAVPVLPAIRSDPLEGLDMRCKGDDDYLKGCLMRDLYFDMKADTFKFSGRKIGSADTMPPEVTRRRFAEETAFLAHVRETSDFEIQWSSRPLPADSNVCRVSVPVHLRQEFPLATSSFGHLLRDNYEGLMHIAKNFGLTPAHFSWVTWPRTSGRRAGELSHVQTKYSTWLSSHPTYSWNDLVAACTDGRLGSPAHRPQRKRKRKVRYVLIETALVSGVGKRWTNFRTRVCEKSSFRDMRNLAYAVNSIPHVPAPQQPRLVISFVYKQQDDKRRMIVDNDVIQSLQERWPDAELGVHDYILEDADTQLAWLSRTSILVTNIGSPSFRLLYLPDGAQVISVGPLEGETMGTDGRTHEAAGRPFGETHHCWQYLDYISIHKYHVTNDADITFWRTEEPKTPPTPAPKPGEKKSVLWDDWQAINIRNAHVHVRTEQLLQLVESAVANITSSITNSNATVAL